jgi:uroporphyrinogen decarboxylase
MSGTVNILAALALEPDWVKDIIDTFLDRTIAHYDMLWDKGYRCDSIMWYDDMGYKGTAFFSNETYRSIIQPAHIRAVNWAHEHGITARLHSCGNIMKLLPDVLETGVDILNPLEVKAGMDVPGIKRRYGSRLTLHGGIDAVLWDKHDAVMAEIESKLPLLKENGGYIFASDHSIPNTVSLKNMTDIVELIKRVGKY